ncbi:hypothetical protein TD95_000541 [Thielaviopsis punctulata]|uniref:Endoplasmic reticulum-based factor for assembly of V-ATPase n=1 Tax=Thielaviopsis punctulata TaxID=72032 RepID=A0A0F4ZAV9_9PEZI|nr:hypothetical protein TD95_000541 [Thielaviopsis punctulata]
MVLLTITPAIVDAAGKLPSGVTFDNDIPSLPELEAGKPISHKHIVGLWKILVANGIKQYSLESLLTGTQVYIAPPPPKAEPTPEFKALMARLREEEEERKYQRMMNPPRTETFAQRYPNAAAFAAVHRPRSEDVGNDEEATYEEVQRQLTLIANFLVSVIGVAATLWIVARWWSTPARLALAMGGALIVGVAEIAVYMAFVWRVDKSEELSKKAEKRKLEKRSIAQTWVLGEEVAKDENKEGTKAEVEVTTTGAAQSQEGTARHRHV